MPEVIMKLTPRAFISYPHGMGKKSRQCACWWEQEGSQLWRPSRIWPEANSAMLWHHLSVNDLKGVCHHGEESMQASLLWTVSDTDTLPLPGLLAVVTHTAFPNTQRTKGGEKELEASGLIYSWMTFTVKVLRLHATFPNLSYMSVLILY